MTMKRPITATLHRKVHSQRYSIALWTRHYSNFLNAIAKAQQVLLADGQPGDVIEYAHSEAGFQIATTRISVGGSTKTELDKGMVKALHLSAKLNKN